MIKENKIKTPILLIAAAIAVAIIIMISYSLSHTTLELVNNETGQLYGRYPLPDNSFSVTFVHSVNKSPVSDIYDVRNGDIYMTGTIYYGFGAGVPDELPEEYNLEFGDNGEMIISNMDLKIDNLVYVVGTVYDHILTINGEQINLRELCGRNSPVRFIIK